MKKPITTISAIIILGLILAGCNLPGGETPTTQVDLLNTAAAQTLQAQQTSIVQTNQASLPEPTNTNVPTQVIVDNTPTWTAEPTDQPAATATLAPTLEPSPTYTPTKVTPCDQAAFITETIPDGTNFYPGEEFVKTWTLKNVGSCTWDSNYDVVFVSGNAMNAPAASPITNAVVPPGETVVVTLNLKAPSSNGTYRGDFKLRNPNGVIFGIGDQNRPFWAEIDVEKITPSDSFYDFTFNYCAAGVEWRTSAGKLQCPGSEGDSEGWVRRVTYPTLEGDYKDDEPGLKVHPQNVTDGWIKGIFPQITLTNNLRFKAVVSCYGSANCNVKFKLNYRVDGGTEQTLGTWHEVQDDAFRKVNIDLSSLAGKNVQFILVVEANGSPTNDQAFWLAPRIEP